MKRRPCPSLVTTTLPALATFLAACQPSTPRYSVNPPPPEPLPTPPPPMAQDAGGPTSLEPTRVDPEMLPPVPLAGAPMMVSPIPGPVEPAPRPAPAPSPAPSRAPGHSRAPAAPAPAAPAPAAAPMAVASADTAAVPASSGLAPGMYIVHNHPPGTPCRPLSHTEVQQAAQRGRNTP